MSSPRKATDKVSRLRDRGVRTRTVTGRARMVEAKALRLLERRYHVWKLRKDGFPVKDIAATLGINVEVVRQDIVIIGQRMAKELSESVEESRFLQLERIDALLKTYQPLGEKGNLAAASMVLQIEQRRSKLLALDMPEQKKIDVTGIREYVGIDLDKV